MTEDMIEESDSVKLLKECDAGTKMAVESIGEVLDRDMDPELQDLLSRSKMHHEKLEEEIRQLLSKEGAQGKNPNLMARGMSWIKTNTKVEMGSDETDSTIADLMTDGCDMGIKSLYKYQNQYCGAQHSAQEICRRLIDIEEQLRADLRKYL